MGGKQSLLREEDLNDYQVNYNRQIEQNKILNFPYSRR